MNVERKAAVQAAVDGESYELTSFGRRRISKVRTWLAPVGGLVAIPVQFLYQRWRRWRGRTN